LCLCICSHTCLFLHFLHVESVAQEYVAVEAEEPGAEGQEEQLLEFEAVEPVEEQFPVSDLANSVSQQGKHRFIYPSTLHKFKSYPIITYYLCIKFIGIV